MIRSGIITIYTEYDVMFEHLSRYLSGHGEMRTMQKPIRCAELHTVSANSRQYREIHGNSSGLVAYVSREITTEFSIAA